jgi:hypothetical protein
MKYCKLLINLTLWHLKPYEVRHFIQNTHITEYGFLCFKLILEKK